MMPTFLVGVQHILVCISQRELISDRWNLSLSFLVRQVGIRSVGRKGL